MAALPNLSVAVTAFPFRCAQAAVSLCIPINAVPDEKWQPDAGGPVPPPNAFLLFSRA